MKGPGLRIDLDVRRAWRCPACHGECRTSAGVTVVRCACRPDAPLMQPLDPPRRALEAPRAVNAYVDIDPDAPISAAEPEQGPHT